MTRSKYIMLTASDAEKDWVKGRSERVHQDISGYIRALVRKDLLSTLPVLPSVLGGLLTNNLFAARDRGRRRKV